MSGTVPSITSLQSTKTVSTLCDDFAHTRPKQRNERLSALIKRTAFGKGYKATGEILHTKVLHVILFHYQHGVYPGEPLSKEHNELIFNLIRNMTYSHAYDKLKMCNNYQFLHCLKQELPLSPYFKATHVGQALINISYMANLATSVESPDEMQLEMIKYGQQAQTIIREHTESVERFFGSKDSSADSGAGAGAGSEASQTVIRGHIDRAAKTLVKDASDSEAAEP